MSATQAPADSTSVACGTAWITIFLYDARGEPVADEEVELTREDEKPVKLTTDGNGRAYRDGLTIGTWEVHFPKRKFDEWKRGMKVTAKPASWIDLALCDAEGKPVGNERYKVTGPDGAEQEGRLDGAGKARVEVSGPGWCKVDFPDRHPTDWWPVHEALWKRAEQVRKEQGDG